MDAKTLLGLAKPMIKMVWEQVLHPELLKLEGQVTQEELTIVIKALDAALNEIIEKELA